MIKIENELGDYMKDISVKLIKDLTKYRAGLIPGIKGVTLGEQGALSRSNDNFITVRFENNTVLDVLWSNLEIIDKIYLKESEERRKEYLMELKTSNNIIKYIGPRGGFKYLSFEYISKDGTRIYISTTFKNKAEELLKIFSVYNLNVEIKTLT